MSCLTWAAGRGHADIVKQLIDHDAKVTTADKVNAQCFCPGFPRLLETHGIVFVKISGTWKALENEFGPGKSWNLLGNYAVAGAEICAFSHLCFIQYILYSHCLQCLWQGPGEMLLGPWTSPGIFRNQRSVNPVCYCSLLLTFIGVVSIATNNLCCLSL